MRLNLQRSVLFYSLITIVMGALNYSAYADVPLDSSNMLGSPGAGYWNINQSGTYYLNIDDDVFSTVAHYAILISIDDVTLDGMGKTITGAGPPSSEAEGTPDVYGVRVFKGALCKNIVIKNLNVENKYYGIAYVGIKDGTIQTVNSKNNRYGIYLWGSNTITVTHNTVENNDNDGIQINAAGSISTDNVVSDNVVSNNGGSGIHLWLECIYNEIYGNTANNNGTAGISLQNNVTSYNKVYNNLVNRNPNGIFILNSSNNEIYGNKLVENSNIGLWLSAANNNKIEDNEIKANGNAGILLNSSENNEIHGNTITLNQWWGIYLGGNNNNQKIYDNYFRNGDNAGSHNAGFEGLNSGNSWNIQKTEGKNIVGGPFLGGNYWARSNGQGFSQLADDTDADGICDSPYYLTDGNVDEFPLYIEIPDTLLNSSNMLGSPGAGYWDIRHPGTYILDLDGESVFSTTHNYAIRIFSSRVTLDGMNKTITGGGPSSAIGDDVPDVYGVRVNTNFSVFDVHVKNLNVEKKHFGIIFEAVEEGSIENVRTNNNYDGIYLWDADSITISGNFSEYNLDTGIVFDAYEGVINSDNVISNNVTSNNGGSGISLWLECVNNTIHGNIANNNRTGGISLQNNASYNTLSNNFVNGNPNGIRWTGLSRPLSPLF